MGRSHGLAQRFGIGTGVATAIAGIATVLATTGCPPSRDPVTSDTRTASDERMLSESGAYHLTIRASRALVDAQMQPLLVSVHATGTGADASIVVVPDDPALDDAVLSGRSDPDFLWSSLSIESLADVCPVEGDCELGLTIEVVGVDVTATVSAATHRVVRGDASDERFPEGATLELVAD